ncbi:hypothetical protein CONCODRAFT_11855 [Conidiobolus coronatus NRRL 28638]|uniref:G-protein coupled receptors family 1 profile domain-containing protein n=1 Tax=Conidiobolus coronatus (strain ATCC 28846 / CBS 209.66 / NRRL 28638) TaxID=796925 RepID=A0A137NU53_CONC2|nr:hypothetical protein CONCODRAFT_11855 [Conidiobolus coronatus NRRL 28638]|eukprot:KXN66335.1 hypothetical protein CONCODRAFT_11855 [Conidiobolus coronatus NRRL 28638]
MSDSILILKSPSITILTEVLMIFFATLALVFNGVAFYITVFRIGFKTAAVGLMAIIATLDIIISFNVIIVDVMNFATSHQILNNRSFCTYTGMIYMLVPMSSIDGIGLLSLLRLLSVSYNKEFKAIYWYSVMGAMFIYNVVINIFGVTNDIYEIMPSEAYCYSGYAPGTYSELFALMLLLKFLVMFALILISYTGITVTVYKTFSQLNTSDISSEQVLCDKPYTQHQRRLIYRLFILIALYMICFGPALVFTTYTAVTNKWRTAIMDSISGIAFSLALLVNSIFVLVYQREARDILISIVPIWLYTSKSNFELVGLKNIQI